MSFRSYPAVEATGGGRPEQQHRMTPCRRRRSQIPPRSPALVTWSCRAPRASARLIGTAAAAALPRPGRSGARACGTSAPALDGRIQRSVPMLTSPVPDPALRPGWAAEPKWDRVPGPGLRRRGAGCAALKAPHRNGPGVPGSCGRHRAAAGRDRAGWRAGRVGGTAARVRAVAGPVAAACVDVAHNTADRWRHPARLQRPRTDLSPTEVPSLAMPL